MKKIYLSLSLILLATFSLSAQMVWDNFEDSRFGTYGFISGTFIPYGENTEAGGSNNSLIAASYTRNAGELFDVIILDGAMEDLTDYRTGERFLSIDVFSPAVGTVIQITLENTVTALPANFPTGRHSVYLTTTTVANEWETLTFAFDNQPDATVPDDDVDRIVLLFAPNTNTGDTYLWDNLVGPSLAVNPCEGVMTNPIVFNDFECQQNSDYTFSHAGPNFRRVVNPDPTGVNTSEFVASYGRNPGEEFDVIVARFEDDLELTATSVINLDVFDPNAPTDILVSLQNENNDVIMELTATTSVSNTWETLTYDPSAVSAATDISRFVVLFDPGNFTGDTYLWDNFQLNGVTSITDLEAVTDFQASPNPTQGETLFQYNLETAANVNLSVFDMTGKLVDQLVSENQAAGAHQATWMANDLANGIYFYKMQIDGATASGKIVLSK